MRSNRILLFILVASLSIRVEGLKLVENGYEDLYIVIQETVSEDLKLLDRIQEIFENASVLLYRATHNRAYFRNLKVIVPKTWTKNKYFKTMSALSAFTSHIRIGNNTEFAPRTVGSEECGQEGLYIYLAAKEFVLNMNTTSWGPHDHVILHEWGHLRWGLKDEYPTVLRPKNNTQADNDTSVGRSVENFYQADGIWKPVGCLQNMLGYASTTCENETNNGTCNTSNSEAMIPAECIFCPSMTQPFNASIMGFQYISSIVEFCDKDDPETPWYLRHNSRAKNEQNDRCGHRSSWEVMREHKDFKDGANPPIQDDDIKLTPNFELLQTLSGKVRIFVLDTSGSMDNERITRLYNAARFIIETVLPHGSWLGLVDFDSDAVLLSKDGIVHIDSDDRRQELVSVLPKVGGGSTCIGCGLNLALSLLGNFSTLDLIQESEMILISDGLNNHGGLDDAIQRCEDARVVVHSISVTETADQRLKNISARTGGKVLFYSGLGFISLAALFSEVISSGPTVDSLDSVTMYDEQIFTLQNVPASVTFSVDDGIGQDTTVTVISEAVCDLDLVVTGPDNILQTKSASNINTLPLVIPGISAKGAYVANVTSSVSSSLEVIVTSKPFSIYSEVIRPLVRISSHNLDFTGSSLPVMYVHVRKGESPIRKATVKALVENSQGNKTCELILLDDGLGVDIKAGDGVYSAVLLRECQSGNGRHSSKVIISGAGETRVANYIGSGSAIIDVQTAVTTETPTGSFERMAVGEAYTVSNFNDTVANKDITAPGRITDLTVIDINSDRPSTGSSRNYTITWTATGDDVNVGQASYYEMRISSDLNVLRQDFLKAQLLNVSGVNMAPNVSGKVERLVMVVNSDKAFTSTTYFAIVAIDDAWNRGPVSNIILITIGLESQLIVIEEECTDNCYAVVKDCGRSLKVANGQVNFTNALTTAGNSVPVFCDIGFKLTGGASIMCYENGTWGGGVTCQIVGCGGISISNGEMTFPEGIVYNATAYIRCDDGYHLNGINTTKCMANGVWNKSSSCEINDCGSNVTIPNGQIEFIETTFGHSAPITCDTGYKNVGGLALECLSDGQWSKTVECEILDCRGTSVVNGEIAYPNGTKYGNKAVVSCSDGYRIKVSDIITCLSTGLWSNDASCVLKDCGSNVTIPNGFVNFTNSVTTVGQTFQIICMKGYRLMGGSSISCQNDGEWGTSATCEIIDCKPTSIANGEVVHFSGTTYNATAMVNCDAGYDVEGTGLFVCLASGLWSTGSRCQIKDCGKTETIPNGQITFTNALTTYGQSVPVTCNIGYERTGGSSIECLADGMWSKSVTCNIVDCGGTAISNGAVKFPDGTKYNATAKLNCHVGFRTRGSGVITCLENGIWSTDSECVLVDCGNNLSLPNSMVNFSNVVTTYGKSLPIICVEGYVAKDGASIECHADGLWSVDGKCEILDCGKNVEIKNGLANFTDLQTTYGEVIPIICNDGFSLKDVQNITCLADGKWSKTPACIYTGDEETMNFKTVTIIASSFGLFFLFVTGLLLNSVIKQAKIRTARKRHMERVPKYKYTTEEEYIEENPDYETTDSQVWCTHGTRGFPQNKQYAYYYEIQREP